MKFFNLSEEQTIDLSELDFVDEMQNGDVWNCIEENSQKLTEFFTMANNLAKAKTDLTDFISNNDILNGLLAKEPFTTFNNQFWLCSDLKEELISEVEFLKELAVSCYDLPPIHLEFNGPGSCS